MKQPRPAGRILSTAILMLFLLALTACAAAPAVIMPESRAVLVEPGQTAPFRGWLISESGLSKLLEAAEKCKRSR